MELKDRKFIGIDELVKIFGLKKKTVYNWVHDKRIPFVKAGQLIRFDVEEIERRIKIGRLTDGRTKDGHRIVY